MTAAATRPHAGPRDPHPPRVATEQTTEPSDALAPYDAVLLSQLRRAEAPDEVMPFLRRVTAGRGIPTSGWRRSRALHHFGGRSPINDQNRALLAALEKELAGRGLDVPLLWGNRNSSRSRRHAARGRRGRPPPRPHRHDERLLLLLLVPAVPREPRRRRDAGARRGPRRRGRQGRAVRPAPGLRRPNAALVVDAVRAGTPTSPTTGWRCSSAPTRSGGHGRHVRPRRRRGQTSTPRSTTSWPAGSSPGVAEELGRDLAPEVVYCARSARRRSRGSSRTSTTGEEELAARRHDRRRRPRRLRLGPLEVVYDLDTEAQETADRLGSPSPASHRRRRPGLGVGLADLLVERAEEARGGAVPTGEWVRPSVCAPAAAPTCARPARPCAGAMMPAQVPPVPDELAGLDLAALEALAVQVATRPRGSSSTSAPTGSARRRRSRPDRRRHRHGHPRRGAHPSAAERGPPRRRRPRRGGRRPPGHVRADLGRRPDRRDGHYSTRSPPTPSPSPSRTATRAPRRVGRPRGRGRGRRAASSTTPTAAVGPARRGGGHPIADRGHRRRPRPLPRRHRLRYTPSAAASAGRAAAARAARDPRHPRIGSAPSTCAGSRPAAWTASSRSASTRGTSRRLARRHRGRRASSADRRRRAAGGAHRRGQTPPCTAPSPPWDG